MRIQIEGQLERFVTALVKAGRYPSARAVVEAAITQMKDFGSEKLTAEDRKVIAESDEQFERGESVDFDDFAAQMRNKYCGK